ncbi:hypothetical protein [Streptomyces sp. 2314.4]|uniref:hypothetical protein n=1 Tax=Streptomyces sp. 2314.4 TaxID=1881025 RepID=UPI00089787A1|nr:hypothetical protein [Streptomyces sp. 2314.4]SEC16075.1 hypothetical protein SAMN05428943_1150 [Streptomyces sp. 2314.4]
MRVFLAGIIQGARTDDAIHHQGYRKEIRDVVSAAYPDAQFVDPHEENLGRLEWSRDLQRDMFLRYVTEAGLCDVLVAWLPEPSMGTSVEMYEAYRMGVPVLTISPMERTWAVFSLATRTFPDLETFSAFVRGPDFAELFSPQGEATVKAGGVNA